MTDAANSARTADTTYTARTSAGPADATERAGTTGSARPAGDFDRVVPEPAVDGTDAGEPARTASTADATCTPGSTEDSGSTDAAGSAYATCAADEGDIVSTVTTVDDPGAAQGEAPDSTSRTGPTSTPGRAGAGADTANAAGSTCSSRSTGDGDGVVAAEGVDRAIDRRTSDGDDVIAASAGQSLRGRDTRGTDDGVAGTVEDPGAADRIGVRRTGDDQGETGSGTQS
ncbi:hypothetical protein [Amycolatopsis sp. H20-H5]|uniref:hypothetical protein n=1 Tax=Amycolatopsis sp. H20-H5 TaxID=3046309 RepID=UPI002DB82CD6|nr:hypothetical protein [Amycolatopsis sp. H20-H5]MEC3982595.1 hypothetical protein [Amycolatopsis sp. H20-H5]